MPAWAYANLQNRYVAERRFAEADKYTDEGLAYCGDNDMTSYQSCLRLSRAAWGTAHAGGGLRGAPNGRVRGKGVGYGIASRSARVVLG
ncbi:hypothetical protein [Nonomuraea sp. NPDC049480]|uniref:hypothetical protein n=1 Tax=Nonomuraea sp. NPDC049480 TaxID=3364353 RepID=UPI0037876360